MALFLKQAVVEREKLAILWREIAHQRSRLSAVGLGGLHAEQVHWMLVLCAVQLLCLVKLRRLPVQQFRNLRTLIQQSAFRATRNAGRCGWKAGHVAQDERVARSIDLLQLANGKGD